ncbi:alcohol dehydrogenase [Talaromyces proteolyticus]|uniref:Alcohol dehydrogenase n=1 Tax=Talaromyces proteolyticus TaxID=1131652 RepID=A0AAD4KWI9_9EURO|nr:alcohol dehydrogenase [Talaromyces proteolyticus]KAH8700788.1 alcohol dehydrogenase [Talaromyces proteolyticus]
MAYRIPKTSAQWAVVGQNGLQDLQLQEVTIPPLGDHDCLIKVEAVSLNFRDIAIIRNQYPLPVNIPHIPTSDGAGTVVAVGARVKSFKVGDKVSATITPIHLAGRIDFEKVSSTLGGGGTDGWLRQYATYEEQGLVPIPRNLSAIQASALPGAGISAWNTLYGSENTSSAVTRIKPGDIVLTQGTGGVSLFVIQLAVVAGATVIATTSTSSGKKVELLKSLGVKHVINYNEDKNWGETAKRLTPNGVGVDHVVDVGGANTLDQSLKAVRFEGTVSVVGFLADDGNSGSGPGLMSTLARAITVRGVLGGSKLQLEELNRAVERLDLKPVIDEKVFEFSEAREAYQYLMEGRHVGKVVIKVE